MNRFSGAHIRILAAIEALSRVACGETAADGGSRLTQAAISEFDEEVLSHHRQEERELCPAVISAARGTRHDPAARAMARRMAAEHRTLEGIWLQLRAELGLQGPAGYSARCALLARRMSAAYTLHAAFEEIEFLPLVEELASRCAADADLSRCLRAQAPIVPG